MQRALSAADAFVASWDSARRGLSDALPGIASRAADFRVIPTCRDFERFVQCADTSHVGAGEPLRILVPGNIGVHKVSGLIAQIKQLDTSGQLQFHLLGTGDSDLKDRKSTRLNSSH